MYTRDNYIAAKTEIDGRRNRARAIADERRAELALRSPEIRQIDEMLRGTGLELFRVACSGGDIGEIRKNNEALINERKKIIKALGYPEDYTDVHYTCTKCSDSGYIDTKMCSCLKELLIMKNIESSGMGRLIERQSFENFDISDLDGADRERMEENLAAAKKYADSFPGRGENLLLIGSTGTGKTHISTAIAKVIIQRGFDVIYDSVQNIINDFETDKFKSGYGQREDISDKYLECDLLIIDDLGTEFTSQFAISCLYNLLNTRQNKRLSTIISTNLSAGELAGKYEGRIYSRIVGSDYRVLFFSGKDRRIN